MVIGRMAAEFDQNSNLRRLAELCAVSFHALSVIVKRVGKYDGIQEDSDNR
jgi:hypothetical protein